jgi:hypothetical protein
VLGNSQFGVCHFPSFPFFALKLFFLLYKQCICAVVFMCLHSCVCCVLGECDPCSWRKFWDRRSFPKPLGIWPADMQTLSMKFIDLVLDQIHKRFQVILKVHFSRFKSKWWIYWKVLILYTKYLKDEGLKTSVEKRES